jgi:hypothetical protein
MSSGLAQGLSQQSGEPTSAWEAALRAARQSLSERELSDEELEELARASEKTERFVTITRLLYQYAHAFPGSKRGYLLFVESANQSPFGLNDWLAALHLLHAWAVEQGRRIEFKHLREYLVCCIYSPEAATPGITLREIVAEMLHFAGYEGPSSTR